MTDQHNPLVLDAAATLNLDLRGIKLIEASAGTGKTYAISNLYLRYVLAGRRVSDILVVTFTNAATEELRGRIRQRLYLTLRIIENTAPDALACVDLHGDAFLECLVSALSEEPKEQLDMMVARLKLAVRTMDEAAIYTIHGFCQRALTDHAFNSGQAFDLELLQDDSLLWQQALKDWWRREAYELRSPDREFFLSELNSLDTFMQRQAPLREAAGKILLPEVADDLQTLYAKARELTRGLPPIAEAWQQRRDELKDILLTSRQLSRAAKGGYKEEDLLCSFEAIDDALLGELPDEVPAVLKVLGSQTLYENSKPTQRGNDQRLEDPFFQRCQTLLDECAELARSFAIRALYEATEFARQQIEQQKQLGRSMSFSDQLNRLHDALATDSPTGARLAENLCKAFPVAMIDEFQDTDAVQYGIFRRLYFDLASQADTDHALIMIGDPKQAIYSFRGGDIFTYMQAKADAAHRRYTLDTNWRSVPKLIKAVNTLFARRKAAFVYEKAIDFQAVQASSRKHQPLRESSAEAAAVTLWHLPRGENGKPLSKGELEEKLHESVATEIARLVNAGQLGQACLGDKPVQPGDIAVLVRTAYQGAALRLSLARRGVTAVTVGRDKVFQSEEARGLLSLLRGVIHYGDRRSLREALGSSLLDYDYQQIADIIDKEDNWLLWTQQLSGLHTVWQHKGFMAMFHSLLQELNIGVRVAAGSDAERRLTNILHLGELLQQNARTYPGLEALLSWYQQQIENAAEEEAELRLESDEALVKIVTIHASKGLEYPVVFIPYLWACKPCDTAGGRVLAFHDEHDRACLDLGSDAQEQHLLRAEKERLAEDVRLAYVALTRARAKLYLAWGMAGSTACSAKTALAWLLYPRQTPDCLDSQLPEALGQNDDAEEALQNLVQESDACIEVLWLPEANGAQVNAGVGVDAAQLSHATFTGRIASNWRISSFSALTRDVHQPSQQGAARSGADPILDFPAGSHIGLFMHALLENVDFQGDITVEASRQHSAFAARYGLDVESNRETVVDWLSKVISTPLDTAGLRLADISRSRRLDEIEFDFSVQDVQMNRLNQALAALAGRQVSALAVENFRGMINGVIDLVFEHQGKFYIVDYKSNFLGGSLADYAPEKLRHVMLDRRYDLQYLLYTLALHRYLDQRIAGYSYAQHFGGVYYLFLRGMRPQDGARHGVYFDRPAEAVINRLDTEILGADLLPAGEET